MRAMDLLISLPPVLLGLLILAVTPPSLWKTILAVGLVYIPILTRLTRAVALGLLEEDFVQAARARGEGAVVDPGARDPAQCLAADHRRVRPARHLRHPARLVAVLPRPRPAAAGQRMGLMIAESRDFLDQAPWICLAPGLSLCVLLVAVNLFGEGLRERLDPQPAGPRPCLTPPVRPTFAPTAAGAAGRRLSVAYPHRGPAWCRRWMASRSSIAAGGVLGLVGESGSGKSTVVLALLGLLGPAARMKPRALASTATTCCATRPPCAAGASASCSRTRRRAQSRALRSASR